MKEKIAFLFGEYKYEIYVCAGLLAVAVVILALLYVYQKPEEAEPVEKVDVQTTSAPVALPTKVQVEKVTVDISGAVVNPGALSLPKGSCLNDALEMAGGLSRKADFDFFARNFNVAAQLQDQEKIYIPRVDEIEDGIFVEGRYVMDQAATPTPAGTGGTGSAGNSAAISINEASLDELDTLKGVGPVTAQKIVDNRPYVKVSDLVDKKILTQKALDSLKDDISL